MTRYPGVPDVRDGLTREERVVLHVLHQTQKERGGRNVPTAMLWGRVCEHFYISPDDLTAMLARVGARRANDQTVEPAP
jgi:hypothetical protein